MRWINKDIKQSFKREMKYLNKNDLLKIQFLLIFLIHLTNLFGQNTLLNIKDIRIRDPFVFVAHNTGLYYLVASKRMTDGKEGVIFYKSEDLKNWALPVNVLTLPNYYHSNCQIWAPELHEYKGIYYLFLTLTYDEKLANQEPPPNSGSWMPLVKRGVQIFWSNNLMGPYLPFDDSFTIRDDWMTLDGTLYVENDTPYMVFCHEWVQIGNGTIELVELSKDLSKTIGNSKTLFKASDAPWVINLDKNVTKKVTDGPFIYKTKTNQIIMIWSSFSKTGYTVGQAISLTGKIAGPWKQINKLILNKDGGHGMIFKTMEGKLMVAIHQPNSINERLKLFELKDCGSYLKLISNE